MNNSIIIANNVHKTFLMGKEEVRVLKNVSLQIEKGEFISIMGESGSGKSTLLYLMGGLDEVTSGSIEVMGKSILKLTDAKQSAMRRKDIGFVFQFYNLIPNLTVEENILLPVLLDGAKKKDYKSKLNEILEIVGLTDRKNHTPRELSGGQQQRTAIARALINDPKILYADEPIGNLDSKNGTQILKLLQKINLEQNKTVVMVTHSKESASYGSRIIYLKDGHIYERH